MENLIEKIKQVNEFSSQFKDLTEETITTKFIDSSTKNEYNTLEEAFEQGVKDLSTFKKIEVKTSPKTDILKMIGVTSITTDDVEVVKRFAKYLSSIDDDAEYLKLSRRLNNKLVKARKADDKKLVAELTEERNKLNLEFGKSIRKSK